MKPLIEDQRKLAVILQLCGMDMLERSGWFDREALGLDRNSTDLPMTAWLEINP